jgi:tetrahydromethanopterin S-methyltransferase subunit G
VSEKVRRYSIENADRLTEDDNGVWMPYAQHERVARRVEELEKVIPFARHELSCRTGSCIGCDCGLSAALAALDAQEEEETK